MEEREVNEEPRRVYDQSLSNTAKLIYDKRSSIKLISEKSNLTAFVQEDDTVLDDQGLN